MEFFTEFLPQILPIVVLMVIGPIVLLVLYLMIRSQSQKNKERAREEAKQRHPVRATMTAKQVLPQEDEEDPLELLRRVREEDRKEAEMESGDLAQLLANMGQAGLHRVMEDPVQVRLAGGDVADARELLSILRDERDGRLMVQIGENAYRTLVEDAEAKRTFTRVMKELSGVILTPDTAPAQPAEAAPPPPVVPVAVPPQEPFKPQPTPPASGQTQQVAAATEEERQPLPGDLPNMRLSDNPDNYKRDRFGRVVVQRVDKAPEINIASAIESYLQFRIEQLPQYQQRGIHIRSALNGGVRIEADGKSYDFVDEIADADVRQFLQKTIAEWQERH